MKPASISSTPPTFTLLANRKRTLGQALKDSGVARDRYIVATKVRSAMSEAAGTGSGDVNNVGLSRQHIMTAVEQSLKRLETDYIDLYQVHGWDLLTPIEETMRALDDLVRQGKVRYIGCSNWSVRHLMKAICLSRSNGWAEFVSLQAYYSLVGRDLEHELLPLCREEGLGVLPWSPLSGGFLSGKYQRENPTPEGARRSGFQFPPIDEARGFDAIEALEQIAKDKDASVAQVALAWLLAQPGVTSIIIGANKMSQLEDNLKAADLQLTPEEIETLSSNDCSGASLSAMDDSTAKRRKRVDRSRRQVQEAGAKQKARNQRSKAGRRTKSLDKLRLGWPA